MLQKQTMFSLSFQPSSQSFGKGMRILHTFTERSNPVQITLNVSGYCRPGEVEPFQITKHYIWQELKDLEDLEGLVQYMDTEGQVGNYKKAVETYNSKQESRYMCATVQYKVDINVAGIVLQYTNYIPQSLALGLTEEPTEGENAQYRQLYKNYHMLFNRKEKGTL
jgi:hypothetical protein